MLDEGHFRRGFSRYLFLGVDVLVDIPLDTSIMEGADRGHPIVISSTSSNPLVMFHVNAIPGCCSTAKTFTLLVFFSRSRRT